jgi:uncharacterized damage-inducible protein DinB
MTSNIQLEVFIKMVLSNWELQNKRLNDLLNNLTDEQLASETAPGRNTGIYLLGHLIAVNDAILPLLNLGDKLYPQLYEIFVEKADKSRQEFPPVSELKVCWKNVSDRLHEHFNNMPTEEWFKRHMSISEEDFAKEPHRNKLNVVINRTNHQSYHMGQLAYLQQR